MSSEVRLEELVEPLTEAEARRLILDIQARFRVSICTHALRRVGERALDALDVANVLRAGTVGTPDLKEGTWRYPVTTTAMTVVVAFRSRKELVIVTAWRNDPPEVEPTAC